MNKIMASNYESRIKTVFNHGFLTYFAMPNGCVIVILILKARLQKFLKLFLQNDGVIQLLSY